MSPKIILSLFIALFMGIATTPVHSGDIISCDSFENCPDGSVPLTNALLELDARVDALEGATAPYVLTTGTQIAENWTDLTDFSLAAAINTDESGNAVDPNAQSWNGLTKPDGTVATAGTSQQCNGWLTGDAGLVGVTGRRTTSSVSGRSSNTACNVTQSLVCIEQ